MYHGVINVYKEAGFTSHDVVARLRGICKQKKIGHTGTLDPEAVGVLPVCLGNATRLCDMLTDRTKEYVASFRLGIVTDTQDLSGKVLESHTPDMDPQSVRQAVSSFVGDQLQVPPMYSALKVDGKRLYELAREGKTVERKARQITIYELELLKEEHPDYTGDEEFNFFMAVAFPDDQLRVLDYNRLVKDLNGYTKESFLEELSKIFDITDDGSADPHPSAKHECTMYLDKSWYTLRFKEGMIDESSPVTSLDVSALQERVLAPLLGIKDPRTDMRIAFVGGIKGSAELQRRVDSGEMSVAFELYPVSVREIMSVADAGMIMPPKSTWFEPKLGSGWFIHRI